MPSTLPAPAHTTDLDRFTVDLVPVNGPEAGDLVDDSDLIAEWLGGRAATTRLAYAGDLDRFAAWRYGLTIPRRLTPDQRTNLDRARAHAIGDLVGNGPAHGTRLATAYRNHLADAGKSPATINRALSSLRSVVTLAAKLGRTTWTLREMVDNVPQATYRDTEGPGLDAVAKIVAALRARDDIRGRRDEAMIRLMASNGLRRAEVAGLDLTDLDLARGRVALRHAKGKRGEAVKVTIGAETIDALAAWLDVRPDDPERSTARPVFVNLDRGGQTDATGSRRISGRNIGTIVAEAGEAAGIPNVRPHGLRHTAITTVLDANGGDLRAAQRFSRHASAQTVLTYDDNRQDLAGQGARLAASALDARIAELEADSATEADS